MHVAFLVIGACTGLCLDQPIPSLLSGIGSAVHVEAGQVDFLKASEMSVMCDSTKGPFCGLKSHPEIGAEYFSVALGIPSQVGLTIPGNTRSRNTPNYSSIWNMFTSIRPISSTGPLLSANPFLQFKGAWSKLGANPAFTSNVQVSIMFYPAVVQSIQFSPPDAKVLVVGRLKGKQIWRKIFGDYSSLVGSDVFAKWRGNGSVFRATVMAESEGVSSGLYVSWRDGDQSFRSISREDIVTQVPGTVETLKTIDQLVLFSAHADVHIDELVLSVGPEQVPNIRVFRSGGGLVFEDDVSAGAVLYSASDLVERNLKVIDSRVTSSMVFGKKLAGAFMHLSINLHQLKIPRSFRSPILLSLFLAEMGFTTWKILKIHSLFASFIQSSVIQQYLNFDEMFNAYFDSGSIKGSDIVSLRLQTWAKDDVATLLRPIVTPGDSFEGTLVCSGELARNLNISILMKEQKSNSLSDLTVAIRIGSTSFHLNAEFNHVFGLLYVPSTDSWPYPLSLYLVRVNTLTLVELMGSVNYVSCGGLIMQPTKQSAASVATARSVPLDDWAEFVKMNQIKFNAILHLIKTKNPLQSHGLKQPFGVRSNDIDLDE